jgi:microcystin-dependent protein
MSSVVIAGDISGSVTLQAPYAAGLTTLTLPAVSGTVLTSASDIPTSSITGVLSVSQGGTGVTTAPADVSYTGTGATVRNTSPVLVTPALGKPASGDLSNCTGFPAAGGTVSPGTILDFGGISAPSGYLGCDGSNVSRTTYATLFAAIGTAWGVGDGSTTFGVPDLRRKVAVGSGGTGTARLANSVGSTGGEESHVQTEAEMAAHSHTFRGGAHGGGLVGYNAGAQGACGLTTYAGYYAGQIGATGSGTAANIMQPSSVVLKIIKT